MSTTTFIRSLLGVAFAAASLSAPAQNMTLFGLIDLGIERVGQVGTPAGHIVRVPSLTGTVSSRLGLRVQEDLGAGYSASAVLEMGIAPDTGTQIQGGRAFGRQAIVALGTPAGTFTLGRQYTMLFFSLLEADILGPNIYGTGSLDAALPNARSDNTIGWRWRRAGWDLGATTSFGRDAVNAGPSPAGTHCPGESASDSQACRASSLLLKYDTQRWGFAIADERQRGRTPGPAPDAVFGGLNSSGRVDHRVSANGWLRLGAVKLGGGVVRRSNDGDPARKRSDLGYVGAAWAVSGRFTIDGQWVGLRYRGVSDRDAALVALRGTWALSRRTALYMQAGRIDNDRFSAVSVSAGAAGSNPAPGASQTALNAGIRHAF